MKLESAFVFDKVNRSSVDAEVHNQYGDTCGEVRKQFSVTCSNLFGDTWGEVYDLFGGTCEVALAQVVCGTNEIVKIRCEQLIEMLRLDKLSIYELQKLKHVVKENNDAFAWNDSELGCTDVVQHVIEM